MLSSLNLSHNGAPTPFQSIFDFYEMTVLFFVSDDGLCWIFRSKFGINQWWSGHSIMGGAYFQIVVSQNSIQSRCVIWDPFSSDLGSICDTICLQKSHRKLNAGGNQLKKRISFTHKNTTTCELLKQSFVVPTRSYDMNVVDHRVETISNRDSHGDQGHPFNKACVFKVTYMQGVDH